MKINMKKREMVWVWKVGKQQSLSNKDTEVQLEDMMHPDSRGKGDEEDKVEKVTLGRGQGTFWLLEWAILVAFGLSWAEHSGPGPRLVSPWYFALWSSFLTSWPPGPRRGNMRTDGVA